MPQSLSTSNATCLILPCRGLALAQALRQPRLPGSHMLPCPIGTTNLIKKACLATLATLWHHWHHWHRASLPAGTNQETVDSHPSLLVRHRRRPHAPTQPRTVHPIRKSRGGCSDALDAQSLLVDDFLAGKQHPPLWLACPTFESASWPPGVSKAESSAQPICSSPPG
ncbi:hypothetical protein F5883DRAFT_91541 [Diaporthe sp. PMI_573]|nr:hypothetical protein F5883DRAFT_91541 [Diaporthaceae sp. PMI_573]